MEAGRGTEGGEREWIVRVYVMWYASMCGYCDMGGESPVTVLGICGDQSSDADIGLGRSFEGATI